MREPKEIAQLIEDNITISNSAFLKNVGLPGTTIANMKSGSMPSADKLGKIAECLGVSVDYLLGIQKNAPANQGESDYIEPISIKADAKTWNDLLNRLSRENKIKLFEHAQLLLKVQDLNDQEGQ